MALPILVKMLWLPAIENKITTFIILYKVTKKKGSLITINS
jgi:hypothetical protein